MSQTVLYNINSPLKSGHLIEGFQLVVHVMMYVYTCTCVHVMMYVYIYIHVYML